MARMRSPNYPAIGLDRAVALIKVLWEKEKRTTVPVQVAARAVGFKSLSGPARTSFAALKKYGLLEEIRDGVRVSDLAVRILHGTPQDKAVALEEAALKPELFRKVYETYRHGSNDSIQSYLITRLGFSEVGAKAFVAAFRETLSSIANLDSTAYIPESETYQEEANMPESAAVATGQGVRIAAPPIQHPNSRTYVVQIGKDMTAQVTFTGGEVRPAHLERLAKYLDLAKGAIEAEEQ